MADPAHFQRLQRGVEIMDLWRRQNRLFFLVKTGICGEVCHEGHPTARGRVARGTRQAEMALPSLH